MKCEEIRETMPDVASGLVGMTPEIGANTSTTVLGWSLSMPNTFS